MNRSGQVLLFQMIWRGRTDKCHPKYSTGKLLIFYCKVQVKILLVDQHVALFHDHSDSKYQTTKTFTRMIGKLHKTLLALKESLGLAIEEPTLLILDGAPAHNKEVMEPINEDVFQMLEFPSIYVVFTLPNRSHTLQVRCN